MFLSQMLFFTGVGETQYAMWNIVSLWWKTWCRAGQEALEHCTCWSQDWEARTFIFRNGIIIDFENSSMCTSLEIQSNLVTEFFFFYRKIKTSTTMTRDFKGTSSMEEHLPYKKDIRGSIPPYTIYINQWIFAYKITKLVTKKWEISDQKLGDKWPNKWPKFVYKWK